MLKLKYAVRLQCDEMANIDTASFEHTCHLPLATCPTSEASFGAVFSLSLSLLFLSP